jgi:hypothetical protein
MTSINKINKGDTTMNLDDLTLGQIKAIKAMACPTGNPAPASCEMQHVVVCTDKRGVVFGATRNPHAQPIVLQDARMCLYWSADVGGVFGLAEKGPTADCKISAVVPSISLEGVTAVMGMDSAAVKAWVNAKVQGR